MQNATKSSPGERAAARSHPIVGTAGHVDHGKTSLVKALTGIDCDRLPEERARGITIELGFAHWALPDGQSVGVVDVPGHEKFVRTMVAGASGIDAVMLIVAADDGVMPQTREHLEICALLGVEAGVVALTKSDLADEETLALVREDIAAAVRGTFLEDAEVIACSAREGRGLGELGAAMARALARVGRRARSGPAFLPIDRVFSISGAGVVVTGSLSRGALAVGDDVDLLPTARGESALARVRGLHVHGASVARVEAPSRVAVNLRGVAIDDVTRGAALATAAWLAPSRSIVVRLRALAGSPGLKKRGRVMLHAGTAQRGARATVLDANDLAAGEERVVRMVLDEPIAVHAGQAIIVRRPDLRDHRTVAGGRVVDPDAPSIRGPRARALYAVESARERVRAMVTAAREHGLTSADLARRCPAEDHAERIVQSLLAERAIVLVDGRLVDPARIDDARRHALAAVANFHRERPVLAGVSPAEIASGAPVRLATLLPHAIDMLIAEKKLVSELGIVRLPTHRAGAGDDLRSKILERYEAAGAAPPLDADVRAAVAADERTFRDALAELKRRSELVPLGGMHFAARALDAFRGRVIAFFAEHPTFVAHEFKTAFGLTRKHAIPLLEWLDTQGVTLRRGDSRIPGPAAKR